MRGFAATLLAALTALALVACTPACRFQGVGTVQLLEFEGGFYGIESDAGDHYRPVNLPEPFASPGLRVRFCADPVEGLLGFQMWGVPVSIRRIEPLEPKREAPPS